MNSLDKIAPDKNSKAIQDSIKLDDEHLLMSCVQRRLKILKDASPGKFECAMRGLNRYQNC